MRQINYRELYNGAVINSSFYIKLNRNGGQIMSGLLSKLFKASNRRKDEHLFCSAIIVAAGSGVRMNGLNKLFAEIDGEPVLIHTLRAFEISPEVDEIIIVARPEEIGDISVLVKDCDISKVTKIIRGGEKRQDSVYIGLMEVSKDSQLAAIHDGARPLVTQEVIYEAVTAAARFNAAAPGVPVKDTVKVVKSGEVVNTPDRATLYAIQTPQVFKTDIIKAALTDAIRSKAEITDDCMAVERLGLPVKITEGDYENIKITTPSDIFAADAILRERSVCDI